MQYTFLVEIGTEELPSKILRVLGESLCIKIGKELDMADIFYSSIHWFASPRRLAVKVISLNSSQNDRSIEKLGPSVDCAFEKDGTPTKETESWAKSCGIKINQAERKVTTKGVWLVYRTQVKGLSLQELLPNIVKRAVSKLPSVKMMRWGDGDNLFVRPVHTVTMLLNESVIPAKIFGITSNRLLYGHRFMGEQEINIKHANQYPKLLLIRGHVIADFSYRKKIIYRNVQALAKLLGGVPDLDDNLLEEVTSLVEWPIVLSASFEEKFLAIPREVIIHIMKNDQKYFPLYDSSGKLMSSFIFVTNIESNNPQEIIAGNEKVMRSRLIDAEFFFNADRKETLESRLSYLDTIIFQKELGSMRDRSSRIKTLSSWVAVRIGADVSLASRAGFLSKCDLTTNMVYEFSDMQGVIGMHYARYDGEEEEVALAQKEQYQPKFSGDSLPQTLVSCAVAIADKIDTLVGMFGIYEFPTGNRDPFALRRAALGILRIIIGKNLPIELQELTQESVRLYERKITNPTVVEEVIKFMIDRLPAWYQAQGYPTEIVQSVLVCRPINPVSIDDRIRAIRDFSLLDEFNSVLETNKRISNVLEKTSIPNHIQLQHSLLVEQAEIHLEKKLSILQKKLQSMINRRNHRDALIEIYKLCGIVNEFFESTMIMVDDDQIRNNRLALLIQTHKLFLQIADFSLLKKRSA